MLATLNDMPPGVRLFVAYGLVILAGIGLAMPWVVNQAVDAPVSLPGLVAMALLAYTIFTLTLVLQRKEAAYGLALGLCTLTLPAIPLAWLSLTGLASQLPVTVAIAALAGGLFTGLSRPSVRSFLREP